MTMSRRAAIAGATAVAASPAIAEAQPPRGVRLRTMKVGDVRLRVAEMGKGPLVLFVHGWPESWYSWRHQLPALAAAGYRAVAPDMRGYGGSDKPEAVEDYDIHHLTRDLDSLVKALGEETAILVGHDWGAVVGWQAMLMYPQTFTAYAAMSVPYGGRGSVSPIEAWKRAFGDNFYYILYFQQPGVAEAEFDADPRGILSRLYLSPDSPREAPLLTDPKMAAGGWIPRLGAPKGLPPWLTRQDLDFYVREFSRSGFRGGINYYRNFHRNWETTPHLADAKVKGPVIFLAGEKDVVIAGATAERLSQQMRAACEDFRGVTLYPGAGHWIQQERPAEVNRALVAFANSVSRRSA
jgi:pimeloyl-ACP methyl ester carboxylesterase